MTREENELAVTGVEKVKRTTGRFTAREGAVAVWIGLIAAAAKVTGSTEVVRASIPVIESVKRFGRILLD